jgi:uroporphyrinogen-III synthase
MAANGFNYSEGVMYRTVAKDLKHIDITKYDMLILFSPTGIHALLHNFPKFSQENLRIAAYGKTTSTAVIDSKLKLHIMAPQPHTPTIITALENYLKESNK